jgi:hypothetical protein
MCRRFGTLPRLISTPSYSRPVVDFWDGGVTDRVKDMPDFIGYS